MIDASPPFNKRFFTLETSKILLDTIPFEVKQELDTLIPQFKVNPSQFNHSGSKLAGQIDNEYEFKVNPPLTTSYIQNLIDIYEAKTAYMEENIVNNFYQLKTPSLYLEQMWVNFQKKYEYNPIHIHTGIHSFVIWYKIPYSNENEIKHGPGKYKTAPNQINSNGTFEFFEKDKNFPLANSYKWENTICLFPATLHHQVYPFYSSDEDRITLAGNSIFRI